jgi:hypothetical protein
VDSSGKGASNVRGRETTRRARPAPNIQIRRPNKPNRQKNVSIERNEGLESATVEGESGSGDGNDTVSQSCVNNTSVHDLSKDDEIEIVLEVIGTEQDCTDVGSECEITTSSLQQSSAAVQSPKSIANVVGTAKQTPSTSDSQSLVGQQDTSFDEPRTSTSSGKGTSNVRGREATRRARTGPNIQIRRPIQLNRQKNVSIERNEGLESATVEGESGSGDGNDTVSQSCVNNTSVHDLSKDDEIEIVLEVIGTEQDCTDVGSECEITTSSLQQSSAVQSPRSIATANLSSNEVVATAKQTPCSTSGSQSLVSEQHTSSEEPRKPTNDRQAIGGSNSSTEHSLIVDNEGEDVPEDASSSLPVSTGTTATKADVISDPKSSDEGAFQLPSDEEFNNDSQASIERIVVEDTDPMPVIQDISLDIPESAIEAAIRSTNEPLPSIEECSECPVIGLYFAVISDTNSDQETQSLSQTQPGTLEDSVVRATRRASEEFDAQELGNAASAEKAQTTNEDAANGETTTDVNEQETGKRTSVEKGGRKTRQKGKTQATAEGDTNEKECDKQVAGKGRSRQKPKPNIQRKRKARGKIVDDDEQETTGDNNGSVVQEEGTSEGTAVQDSSLASSCVNEDGSLGDASVQLEDGDGLEGSPEGTNPEVSRDPLQDGSTKKSVSKKRQGKAVKPKIPAKRARKKAGATQETDRVDGGDGTENPVSYAQ